ncbi:DNA-binding protein [Variovorax sp. ZS18.2.2]|uniref:DNA-binding protein n=1 Tax=Variovorax sp. ZS18.2.2 TaxID=2971255 RepID=UPI0021515569|nr:DNA-binding protein [Variovorax sp. ZS18.2.2]MCR6481156.1 DNA-binding protein [Variovorax sp. ZS18.2.2]
MAAKTIVPLEQETRSAIPTAEAAHHLSRSTATLQLWACKSTGPLKPLRVGGRLAWPVADLKRLMGLAVEVSEAQM